ncbi:hydrogenobyrinic acid a,c-diamide synthase (glutamine-hydrolysing) /cobyrinate a,c-diamide synthase [Rhodobacter sp. JA431]|uniref:cobyrinate a,c-diamide synthase n=1 Tax=Rhodobacter sp. JA431 TaxID=570013 RepID=UPI000BCAEE2A|nr:cobyrinate a,c-diamide synthase [Rhodobacter sp. JA431]SOB99105.1 hydrogenobyrinic acid a,c-diamide synthase (glutamine-hydrolysing) /cobyrinate a,c-diamide synthase [Rhodobacter sp. JA431]
MSELSHGPKGLAIAAPASGSGKTTLTLGLLGALRARGRVVQPFKNGPDYIDPAFHAVAAGRASFNLDGWAMGTGLLGAIAAQAAGADLVIFEGAMGLYDGPPDPGRNGRGSSAELAKRYGWPVVLVLDTKGQGQSAAATALGFARHPDAPPFAGVIVNNVASPRHEGMIRAEMARLGLPVLGALPRNPDMVLPERHLGLVQAGEQAELAQVLEKLATFVATNVDLDALEAAASAAPPPAPGAWPKPPAQRIALARDVAFSFAYPHMLEGWSRAGVELLPFSPLADEAPDPSADLVWLPGGYPELHAGKLAAANTFLTGLRNFAAQKPVHGECGGYMVLGEALVDKEGVRHRMAGLLGLVTSYAKRRLHLGYRAATLAAPMPGHAAGTALWGHEFHYSTILEQPDAPLAEVRDAAGNVVPETGSVRGHVSGSFFHLIAD